MLGDAPPSTPRVLGATVCSIAADEDPDAKAAGLFAASLEKT